MGDAIKHSIVVISLYTLLVVGLALRANPFRIKRSKKSWRKKYDEKVFAEYGWIGCVGPGDPRIGG